MVQIRIDNKEIKVSEGTTVLEAARYAGIDIPSMCWLKGYGNSPSCMVCLVKDRKSGNLTTSCSLTAVEGMDFLSNDPEVFEARKAALELLLSDHVGDCDAPCSVACPAGMNIPLMNRLIASEKFDDALKVVKEDIALPHILGYICPAPCEKACRRKQVDDAVSVCLLKRFSAANGTIDSKPVIKEAKKVAIIGSGPAGLAAAYYLLNLGYSCVIFDKNEKPGGTLRYTITEEQLPRQIIDAEVEIIRELGAEFRFNCLITKETLESEIKKNFDSIVIATGDILNSNYFGEMVNCTKTGIEADEGNLCTSVPGIFVCGSAIRAHKMSVRSVAQGKTAAAAVHYYLQGMNYKKPARKFNSRFDKLLPVEYDEYLRESEARFRRHQEPDHLKGLNREEAVMEAMRCMHCDCRKNDTCKLREYADQYKADRKKYLTGDRKAMTKLLQHARVLYEPEKCIKCGLCIEITLKYSEVTGLTYVGRGFDVRVNASLGASLSEGLTHTAKLCADACPTGALSLKNQL